MATGKETLDPFVRRHCAEGLAALLLELAEDRFNVQQQQRMERMQLAFMPDLPSAIGHV